MKTQEQIAMKKLFAGDKKASMKRRDDRNDYQGRKMYMITMEVEGRLPLFGKVVGDPFAPKGSAEAPHMELSSIGIAVQAEWQGIPRYYPQIEVIALQLMPDHLHGILFVHEKLPVHLGQVLAGFKKGCERKWKAITGIAEVKPQPTTNSPTVSLLPEVSSQVAALPQQTSVPRLFALGYNDLLLKNYNEFGNWKHYLADNPYRLAMKRARPEMLRVKMGIDVCGSTCSAVGNLSLLSAPKK